MSEEMPPMAPQQAIALALLIIDFECEFPQVKPPPPGWINELLQARQALGELHGGLSPMPAARRQVMEFSRNTRPRRRG